MITRYKIVSPNVTYSNVLGNSYVRILGNTFQKNQNPR